MTEPISLALAKQQLRVDVTDQDDVIGAAIADARGWVEDYTGQTLVQQNIEVAIDCFDSPLLAWPINGIQEVRYIDRDRTEQTLSDDVYSVAKVRRPGVLTLKSGKCWPRIARGPGQIVVVVDAGYADSESIPRGMVRAMMFLLTGFYDGRDGSGLSDMVEAAAKNACGARSRGWRVPCE